MNVSACLVTRGDHDLTPITDSLTASGIDDIVIWNNAERDDLAVYGRYAAIAEAKHDLILVQDDDCVLPRQSIAALTNRWKRIWGPISVGLVANMPQAFRHTFYQEHALVGFGAMFHRDLPWAAFDRFHEARPDGKGIESMHFLRTCDIVFTGLTPRILVDVEYQDLPWAEDESRMYRQPEHVEERMRMLDLVRQVRDA